MAFLSTTDFAANTPSVGQKIKSALGSFFTSIVRARSRQDQVQALDKMSDAELAEIGIRREDIVRHVFRDVYYG